MNKLEILKRTVETVVSVGVAAVIGNAIKSTTPVDIKTYSKVIVGIGGFVVSTMVKNEATKRTNNKFDEIAQEFKDAREKAEQTQD